MGDYTFNPDLACIIGVDEAIMVQNIVFWIKKNIANKKHYYDGNYWTYNSIDAFTELFPFWTAKQIRRIMESLYEKKVVIKGNYNKQQFDRTGWYGLDQKYFYLLGIIDLPKWANGQPERANAFAEKGNTIPYSNTDSKQSLSNDNDTHNDLFAAAGIDVPIKEKPKRKNSGQKEKVLMCDSLESNIVYVKEHIGEKFLIADVVHYHEAALDWSNANNKKMADWCAVIRGFIRRAIEQNKLVRSDKVVSEKLSTPQDYLNYILQSQD